MFRELCPISHLPFRSLPTRDKVVRKGVEVVLLPFFPPSVCAIRRASDSAMLGQSIRRFTTSVVRRSHYEEGPGKNLPFSVENKWRLLAMMTLYFGSGFAAPFYIVRHQLLKK
uniref:Cytochrome c oxidase subunit 7C, mitochondrial n=6 Tax=Boreoeutheria TaxID=1437010 RepID=A0A8C9B9S1_PHOSS